MKLVLPCGHETDLTELREVLAAAIKAWHKSDRAHDRAIIRMKECASIIEGCRGRIRLLEILERNQPNDQADPQKRSEA